MCIKSNIKFFKQRKKTLKTATCLYLAIPMSTRAIGVLLQLFLKFQTGTNYEDISIKLVNNCFSSGETFIKTGNN